MTGTGREGVNFPAAETHRPLRVALVTSSYNYIRDGIALTLNRAVGHLERHGVEVLIFAPVGPVPALQHEGTIVPVSSIPLPSRPEYRLALGLPRRVQRRMAAFAPDLVHIAVPDLLGFAALRYARKRNTPVVASYHTRYETYLRHYWFVRPAKAQLMRYLRWFYNSCREVYVPSPCMAETLLQDGVTTKLRLWPRGVDTEQFHPRKRRMEWRARYGIAESDVVVIQVSRLVREKQLDTFAAALQLLDQQKVPHRVVITGDGPERRALQHSLPQAIFTGALAGEELSAAYASADIFFFPSTTESFGNVTLEAMASGLPCICADATGSRSLVRDGDTGYLVRPGEAAEFAGQIRRLIEDRELRQAMGSSARMRSLEYSWDEAMGRLLGYYQQAAAEQTRNTVC